MKILITSGGTTEAIDQVRGITNHATGHLGKIIAERFLAGGHQVTLVTTKQAVKPEAQEGLRVSVISDVASLLETLEPLVKSHDVLIHSMAVSDYTPVYMTDIDELEKADSPAQLLTHKNEEAKISSKADYQVLFLKKTPKIISLVKTWNPHIRLVGFKLLVAVEKAELFQIARKSLVNNQAELIVANDLKDITPDQHLAYLVDQDAEILATTKSDIADKLYERLTL
ncbi:phosphopantothenate--cysteine ligase [Streptococcus plurextorum]|uniref:phosphopantothenate--cysteine ligase n=1 Tax=Streptococcus plurextorum TaxID=456876 RepID=UPI00040386C3|nr:phosphopantothenate--cysteine ligase [Streptococcus plurextorum]